MRTVSTPPWGYPRDARLHISTNGKGHEAIIRLIAILNNLPGPATELVGKVIRKFCSELASVLAGEQEKPQKDHHHSN